jgi:tungstate transport system permease protein
VILGLPIGLVVGLGRFPGRRTVHAAVNAGLGLPPIVVGLVVSLLLLRQGPLGNLHWIYTVQGMIFAQTLLGAPIVASLSAAAFQAVDPALRRQARALGASGLQVGMLAIREARIGVLAAVVAALGSALSEVGAIVLVGGNIEGDTQTLASAVLARVSAGQYSDAIAFGVILIGLIALVSGVLTVAQQAGRR